MRALKFRAWNKQENKMSLPFTFDDLVGDIYWSNRAGVEMMFDQGRSFHSPSWDIEVDDFSENGKLILSQYTGVNDRKGKEIYVGIEAMISGAVIGNKLENPELMNND